MTGSRLAILPARGGSTRIKDKAVRPFMGRPLIAWSLAAAAESGLFAEIHVSTDSPRIAEVAARLGHPPAFARIATLAENAVALYDVLQWVVESYEKRGRSFDSICMIYPAAPLLTAADLRGGSELFERHQGRHPVVSVVAFPTPIERAMRVGGDGLLQWDRPDRQYSHSQDLGTAYYDSAGFMMMTPSHLRAADRMPFRAMLPYVLPPERAVDINTEEDLRLAGVLYRGLAAEEDR